MAGACPRCHLARCLSPTGDSEAGSRGRILLSGYDNGCVALRLPLTPYYPAPAKQAGAFCGGFSKSFAFVSRETSIPAPPLEQRFT